MRDSALFLNTLTNERSQADEPCPRCKEGCLEHRFDLADMQTVVEVDQAAYRALGDAESRALFLRYRRLGLEILPDLVRRASAISDIECDTRAAYISAPRHFKSYA